MKSPFTLKGRLFSFNKELNSIKKNIFNQACTLFCLKGEHDVQNKG